MIEVAKSLAARAAEFGHYSRTLTDEECRELTAALPIYPAWLLDLLTTVPLCGLDLGWLPDDPDWDPELVCYLEVSSAKEILSETLEAFPGLTILSAGYVNFGCDAHGGGDPYFIPTNEGMDPPLYQFYHDFSHDLERALSKGRYLVAPRLSEFLRTAILAE